jgi:hypothetical protein
LTNFFKDFIFCAFSYILNTDIVSNCNIYGNETALNVIADQNIGCEVNVVYDPPEDGLVRAETCVGVE